MLAGGSCRLEVRLGLLVEGSSNGADLTLDVRPRSLSVGTVGGRTCRGNDDDACEDVGRVGRREETGTNSIAPSNEPLSSPLDK